MEYFFFMFSSQRQWCAGSVGLVCIGHINYSSVSRQLQIYSWLGETFPAGAFLWCRSFCLLPDNGLIIFSVKSGKRAPKLVRNWKGEKSWAAALYCPSSSFWSWDRSSEVNLNHVFYSQYLIYIVRDEGLYSTKMWIRSFHGLGRRSIHRIG